MSYLALSFLLVSILFFIAFVVVSLFNHRRIHKMDYRLRNYFPYELNYRLKYKENFYGNMFFALFVISNIFFLIFFDQYHNDGYLIFALIAGAMLLIIIILLIYVPLDKLRLFTTINAFLFVFSLALPAGIFLFNYFKFKQTEQAINVVGMVLSLIGVLVVLILLANPKLSNWAKMDEQINEDGSKQVIRPKYFVLAYSEWILLFLFLYNEVVLLISTI